MAGSAVVGALRVDLGLDSAQFVQGLKDSQNKLTAFGKAVGVGMAAVAISAVAAGSALAAAVKGAIDHADEVSKASQKIGVSVEALSRLEYAAGLSDISLEELTLGLGKLSQNMMKVAEGAKGPAVNAFKALGISVTDAGGHLRGSDDVLRELADRFSRMPDGAQKTALAIDLLGKSGAKLIPLLDGGTDSLDELAAEADRLGITLDTGTAQGAEAFNDSITKLQAIGTGLANKIMTAVLPSLNELMDTLSSPDFAKSAQDIGTAIVDSMNLAVKAVNGTVEAFTALRDMLGWMNTHDITGKEVAPDLIDPKASAEFKAITALKNGKFSTPAAGFFEGIFPDQPAATPSNNGRGTFTPPIINDAAIAAADKAAKAYQHIVDRANDRIAQSKVEAQALGMTEEAANRLRYETDLLSDATKNGATITQAQRDQLVGLADSMASAEEQTRRLTEVYNLGQSVFEGFFSDMKQGLQDSGSLWGSLANAAANALDKIADKALSLAANGIFDMIFNAFGSALGGGGSWNIPTSFVPQGFYPGLAGGGTVTSGGLTWVGEDGPELLNLPGGSQVIPNHEIGGAMSSINMPISIDARGAQQGVGTDIASKLKKMLPDAINDAQRRAALRTV